MDAVRVHKTKAGAIAPTPKVKSLVLFTDRMVTNCPIDLTGLYHKGELLSRPDTGD